MSNRTTVKSNIAGLNVPTVTNAIMGQMLVDNICDNVVFREDIVKNYPTFSTSLIEVDFSISDRIEISRYGGSLNITVNGVNDGEVKFLHITKTSGESLSFTNVTDITPVKFRLSVAASFVYRITKKLNQFIAEGLYETVLIADVDNYAGVVTPVTGLTGSDFDANNCPRVPIKSAVKAGDDALRGELVAYEAAVALAYPRAVLVGQISPTPVVLSVDTTTTAAQAEVTISTGVTLNGRTIHVTPYCVGDTLPTDVTCFVHTINSGAGTFVIRSQVFGGNFTVNNLSVYYFYDILEPQSIP